ncbi:unnamed protein product [Meganyctiphanes norvegica]|uniref:Protein kinase domain-containing protein n=1 Tax=Meganyctiphanes norvegica TaxID=48144 RepID=A0AAV2PZ77_MEGNR
MVPQLPVAVIWLPPVLPSGVHHIKKNSRELKITRRKFPKRHRFSCVIVPRGGRLGTVSPRPRDSSTLYPPNLVLGLTSRETADLTKKSHDVGRDVLGKIGITKRFFVESHDSLLLQQDVLMACHNHDILSYAGKFTIKYIWGVLRLLLGGMVLDILNSKKKSMPLLHGLSAAVVMILILKASPRALISLSHTINISTNCRDVKAGNILLGEDGTVQIADFGVSAWLSTGGDLSRQKSRHTFVGTPCWMAPEVMEQVSGYDFKADIWSFGITAIEMVTGTAPYHKYPPMKVLMLTLQNDPPNIDTGAEGKDQYKGYGRTIRKMVSECLQKDPTKRPTATELLKHPFFKRAKDRRHLQQVLLHGGPSIEERVTKQNKGRAPGTSGRLHRTQSGDWVWSVMKKRKKRQRMTINLVAVGME